jgi:hypothetical protein
MTNQTGEATGAAGPKTVDKERLCGETSPKSLIPTDSAFDFADRFPNASGEELQLLRELNDTCTKTMDALEVPRYNMIQAVNIFREDLEHATAPANGPRPNRLETVVTTRDYAKYPGQTRTGISQLDSVVEDALKKRDYDQQVVRAAVQNFATELDFQLDDE